METATYAVLTIATTDDTTTEADVIADAETNSVHEVYPEGDADPVWINPAGAVAISREALDLILTAALVALDGYVDTEPDADPAVVAEAFDAVTVLRANLPA